MITNRIIRKGMPNFISRPSAVLGTGSRSSQFSTGDVLSVAPLDKIKGLKGKIGQRFIELYLHIKLVPVSSRIESVDVISNKQVEEQRKISDDLLNIYLPLAREIEPNNEIFEKSDLRTNFLFLPDNEDRALSFYFDLNRVHFTGHKIDASVLERDEQGNQVVNEGALSFPKIQAGDSIKISDGQTLYMVIEGRVYNEQLPEESQIDVGDEYIEIFRIDFVVNDSKEEGEIEVFTHEYNSEPQDNRGARSQDFDEKLRLIYPLGFVENGNFVHGREPSSIEILRQEANMRYFDTITEDGDGCDVADFIERREIFISI